MSLTMAWLAFAACAGAIAAAGTVLCREADTIAQATGLSRGWIGLVLLATATSLPELVTGLASVAASAPDIAVGDVLGSAVFNLGILGGLYLYGGRGIAAPGWALHRASARFGAALLAVPAAALALGASASVPALGSIGAYTPVILVGYLAAIRATFLGATAEARSPAPVRFPRGALRRSIARYAVAALIVGGAGTALPFVSVDVAAGMGWSESSFGTLFVAAATSLPELSVTISAVRIGAFDMAIGNLLGSNLFDVAILAIDDIAYLPGPILAHVSPLHAIAATAGVLMSLAALARPSRVLGATLLAAYVAHVLIQASLPAA